MQAVRQAAPAPEAFPRLRAGVTLSDAGYDRTGMAGFVLHDPVRHRFYRLSSALARILVRGAPAGGAAEAQELADFLKRQRLVEGAMSAGLLQEWQAQQQSVPARILHSYLSFRIPLVNPQPFLDALLPVARLLVSRVVIAAVLLSALLGLYFAGRQWDHFKATFMDYLTPQGALLYGVTLTGLKVFHELGHGFTARHHGCNVPVMGINFLVMTPMLYTDASDAWRLPSRKQRFLIGAAGVLTEMAIASLVLLLWAFLPDGPLRSATYFIAATAWIMSLTVNLSPFMRFDGYHMLVDATGLHSIGPRAFALATWQLRDLLFQTGEPLPEFHPPARRRALVALAVGTWIYRLTVFGGIAVLVYHMFPKAVGLPLGFIEIHWFIVKPVLRELMNWKELGMKRLLGTPRSRMVMGGLAVLMLLAALPLDRHVAVPAVLTPAQESRLYAPEPAQLRSLQVKPGDAVRAGEVLAVLQAPEIAYRRQSARLRLAITDAKLARLAADAHDRAQLRILSDERATITAELDGLSAREERLVLRAPFDGVVAERMEALAPPQWVSPEQMLLQVFVPEGAVINGLVAERESGRLTAGARGRFIGDDGATSAVTARLAVIGNPGGAGPAVAYLAARHGGSILTAPEGAAGRDVPVQGYLPLILAADGPAPTMARRGQVVVEAAPQSFLGFVLGRVVTVFLRESGF